MAERSKAKVCGRALAGIAGSNPAGDMDVCVVCCTKRTIGKDRAIRTKKYRGSEKIPPGEWLAVCCECCVLSGRGLRVGPIPRPEESYRLWSLCVIRKTSRKRQAKTHSGL